MNKERLEEHTHVAISISEYKELKERVQELESDKEEMYKLNQELGRKAWGIEQQNKRYREEIEKALAECVKDRLFTAEKILAEALEGEE